MSDIKSCFISRWGDEGVLMQTDFSQLEVIGVAHLSQDHNLITDILEGKDMHCMSASFLFNTPYDEVYTAYKANSKEWIGKRKAAKGPSFQLQYGAGYKSIAAKNELSETQAKQFVENYYSRYYQLKQWQDDNVERVLMSRAVTDKHTPKGNPIGRGELWTETGRRYAFTEEDAPEWVKASTSFSPTKIKNYPSQGFATGDIVPMCLGELYYELMADWELRERALLINTIHDSVMLDVHKSVLPQAVQLVESVLTSAPQLLKTYFGIEFNLPLKVETEVGPNWSDMEVYSVGH